MIDAREHYDPKLATGLIARCAEIAGSKTELAERIGMTRQYLNAIVRGDKTMSYGMQVMLERIIDEAE